MRCRQMLRDHLRIPMCAARSLTSVQYPSWSIDRLSLNARARIGVSCALRSSSPGLLPARVRLLRGHPPAQRRSRANLLRAHCALALGQGCPFRANPCVACDAPLAGPPVRRMRRTPVEAGSGLRDRTCVDVIGPLPVGGPRAAVLDDDRL